MYKSDCFGASHFGYGCTVLNEILCAKGECPFHATEAQVAIARAKSIKTLAERRLKPVIKYNEKNEPIQSVTRY